MRALYVLIVVEGPKVVALPTIYSNEVEAVAALGWNLKLRNTAGWVMSFPEPREIADNDDDTPGGPSAA